MLRETGFYLDQKKRIMGVAGPSGFSLDGDDYLVRESRQIGVYIEDGHFFKAARRLFFFTVYARTGHQVDSAGRILGEAGSLPWDP